MIEAKIPKDIRKYETKIVGPLTARQLVCGILAVGAVVFVTFVIKPLVSISLARFLQVLSTIPFGAFMFVKPYGMPLEKFLQLFWYSNILSPAKRKYANKNAYESIQKKIDMLESQKKKSKGGKKNGKAKEKSAG